MDVNEIIPLAIIMSVPLTGIVGWTLVTIARTIFGKSLTSKETKQMLAEINQLRQEREEMKQRVENLETIVTGIDSELLEGFIKLQSINNPQANKQKVERMASNANPQRQQQLPPYNQQSIDENLRSIVNKILLRVDSFLDENNKKNPNDLSRFR
jgi:glutamyl-tRNA reductase